MEDDAFERLHKLSALLDPRVHREREKLKNEGRKLVYYTSAETALKILDNKEVWMRNARCMNDYSEVQHGLDTMRRFLATPTAEKPDIGRIDFEAAIEALLPGMFQQMLDMANHYIPLIEDECYITCLSVHEPDEDLTGRLSMWRAYGVGPAGIALVVNIEPFYEIQSELGAFSNPVIYQNPDEIYNDFRRFASVFRENIDFIKTFPVEEIVQYIFLKILTTAVGSKHPGFKEEKEWRVVHIGGYMPPGALKSDIVVLGGIPQKIMKIPLGEASVTGHDGMEISRLLHRAIVGPTDYPDIVSEAIIAKLKEIGVSDADSKVVRSDIPLRN